MRKDNYNLVFVLCEKNCLFYLFRTLQNFFLRNIHFALNFPTINFLSVKLIQKFHIKIKRNNNKKLWQDLQETTSHFNFSMYVSYA